MESTMIHKKINITVNCTMKKIGLLLLLSFLQLNINAQEANESIRDSVFLKNGNIISGTILNPGSENNIQIRTGGSSVLYVSQSQIDRIAIHTKAPEYTKNSENSNSVFETLDNDKYFLSVWGGLAAPGGTFASVNQQYSGFAKAGWMLQANGGVRVKENVFWSSNIAYTSNAFKEASFAQLMSNVYQAEVTYTQISSWDALHLNSGITWNSELDNDFQLFAEAHLGLIRAKSPSYLFTTREINGSSIIISTYSSESEFSNAFSISLGAGIIYKNTFALSLTMLNSRLNFDYGTDTLFQPYRIFGLQMGYFILHKKR
jgi:hypothetical protein